MNTLGPWELVEATDDGNAVISPPVDSLRAGDAWWTAVIICTDRELQNKVGRIMHAGPELLSLARTIARFTPPGQNAEDDADTLRSLIVRAGDLVAKVEVRP